MIPVMLVDDEPIVKMALRSSVPWEENGYHICATASGGEEALQLCEAYKPSIILCDLRMPGMDGLTLIRKLRAQHYAGAILVLSNYDDFESVRTALTDGADDYMLKVNINAEALLKRLQGIREKRALAEASDHMAERQWFDQAKRALLENADMPEELSFPCAAAFLAACSEKRTEPSLFVNNALEALQEYRRVRMAPIAHNVLLLLSEDSAALLAALKKLRIQLQTYQSLFCVSYFFPIVPTPDAARKLCANALGSRFVCAVEHAEVTHAVRYIETHLRDQPTVDQLAREVNLSKSYLCRVFKQETGWSIVSYWNTRRLIAAAAALAVDGLSIKQTAQDNGFGDQLYFSRMFRKLYGCAPSEYKLNPGRYPPTLKDREMESV